MEVLWRMILKAWEDYDDDKIARAFVHHCQVAAAIYDCEGGDEFVQERNGLSMNVRKVCSLLYPGDDEREAEAALDLTSMRSRDENRRPQGVVVNEVYDGVDLEAGRDKKLKYPLPDMSEHAIGDYLSYDELALIAGDINDVPYNGLHAVEKDRYDKFVEAWYEKCDEVMAVAQPQQQQPQPQQQGAPPTAAGQQQ